MLLTASSSPSNRQAKSQHFTQFSFGILKNTNLHEWKNLFDATQVGDSKDKNLPHVVKKIAIQFSCICIDVPLRLVTPPPPPTTPTVATKLKATAEY